MNKCYLDANVLIYFKNEDSPFFQKAVTLITYLREHEYSLFISPLTLDEFLHGLRAHTNQFPLLSSSLEDILNLPSLTIVNPPTTASDQRMVVSYMKEFSLRPRDAYHLLTIKSNNIERFATFDRDFKAVFKRKLVLPIAH